MKLIKIPDLKTFLEKTDTVHDALLAMIVEGVSARIQQFLNRNLVKAAYSQYFDAGRRMYYLPAWPIDENATLTITFDGVAQEKDSDFFVWAENGLIEFDYSELPYDGPKDVYIAWTGGFEETAIPEVLGTDGKNYRCILTHVASSDNKPVTGGSYATYWVEAGTSGVAWVSGTQYIDHSYLGGIPDDMKFATILQCAYVFRRRSTIGVSSMSMPDGSLSVNLPLELLPEVKSALKPYRRVPTVR